MVGDADASSVEPVVNPGLGEARRRRLVRMTKEQIAGRAGPLRQVRHRDRVVSPLALELECRKLLQRAQRAIATIVTSRVYAGDLRGAVEEPVLRQHEWEIAVALREITELLLDLVSSYGGGTAGPMTAAVLVSQNRAISIARDATTARVLALELLAAQIAAAEAARRDWETSLGWRPTTTSTLTCWREPRRTSTPPRRSRAWPSRPPRRRKRSAKLCSEPPWPRRR